MVPVVKVSVVVATYCPGDHLSRVVESLDSQTMPQSEFEVVFVDDGSPDDTVERLRAIAATRPNVTVLRIENTGWPSRPRNVGIEHARGEYVMFMDHDDSLYPDALRRAHEYATEHGADVLSPKELKTNDVWWGTSSLTAGNIGNVLTEHGVDRLMPMVPHKLYRRGLLLDHDIRFPEGARVLWEDWFVNLAAYRHAKVVSVLADTPCYLWHASDTNSSHTFSPSRVDFWDRLDDLMLYIARCFDGVENAAVRATLLAHHVRTRVVDRCVRLAADPDPRTLPIKRMALRRAQRLLARHVSDEVYALLPKKHQAQLYLMHAGDLSRIAAFHRADLALVAGTVAEDVRWADDRLVYDTVTRWEPVAPGGRGLERRGGRVLRSLDDDLARSVPPELLDHTDDVGRLVAELAVRSRAECVTWLLPLDSGDAAFEANAAGDLSLVRRGSGGVDLASAQFGSALDATVWDVRARTEWVGMERKGPLRHAGPPLPVLASGRGAVAYANNVGGLSLDLDGRLRTLSVDAVPSGPAGAASGFAVGLANVSVSGRTELAESTLVAVPDAPPAPSTEEGATGPGAGSDLHARVVAGDGTARLEGWAELAPGRYVLHARRGGTLHRTTRAVVVDEDFRLTFGEDTDAATG